MVQPLTPFEEIGTKRTGIHGGGRPQKYVLTDSQRRILLERYDGRTDTLDDLMRYFPGMPRWSVLRWARNLGLARQKEPAWSQEDIAYLERNITRKSIQAIAKHLGRTQTAVKLKAKRLDLKKTQEGYTLYALMLGLGLTNHRKVYEWVEKGWLRGTRRHSDRKDSQGGDIWYFTDNAIRDLVKNHPEQIDPRRVDWLWLVDILVGGLGSLAGDE